VIGDAQRLQDLAGVHAVETEGTHGSVMHWRQFRRCWTNFVSETWSLCRWIANVIIVGEEPAGYPDQDVEENASQVIQKGNIMGALGAIQLRWTTIVAATDITVAPNKRSCLRREKNFGGAGDSAGMTGALLRSARSSFTTPS
jgi:hypothetical protein